ncbi:SDR family NAD(P)-dependent oxidoreductase [Ancylomarina sp. 16SWW S1-10-2]|uniref:SDR family NAD(P)-dependent oxidoreductase n=1 Tax=Ancylomarina sp. 16SWW S1-10-2 TaxID=2499681 RepID=UPI0012AD4F72|nr:SDR family NAD(P)-dependent oxidoreductase [Ancylomarina sp. 16SWW S1-10-2]
MKAEGKVAIITGGSGGIGFQVSKRLGEDGYSVYLMDIADEAKGAERVKELAADGIKAAYFSVDLTKEDGVTSTINTIGAKEGKIDLLVNCAGGLGGRSRFEGMTTEFFRFVMALNLDSAFFTSRAAIPFLKKGTNA